MCSGSRYDVNQAFAQEKLDAYALVDVRIAFPSFIGNTTAICQRQKTLTWVSLSKILLGNNLVVFTLAIAVFYSFSPSHKRNPRWTTQRVLHMGIREEQALFGKSVYVWCCPPIWRVLLARTFCVA